MNRGLKSYTKQLTQKIGPCQASVNVNPNDANMHLIIPLLETLGHNPICTSLIFNYIDREEDGIFGKGIKLNYYAKITGDGSKVTIKNADGSQDVYLSSENFKNTETGLSVKSVKDTYEISSHYEVVDQDNNSSRVYGALTEYPSSITTKAGKTTLNFVDKNKTISNGYGDSVVFEVDSTGKVAQVKRLHNNSVGEYIKLSYLSGVLTSIEYYSKENGLKSKVEIKHLGNRILVLDSITGYSVEYTINEGKITKIQDGYGETLVGSHSTSITYGEHKATIVDWKNMQARVFFDNDGLPLFQIDKEFDEKNNIIESVIETEYDSKTKALTAKSSPIIVKGGNKNYFGSNTLANFDRTNATIERITTADSDFGDILGTVYKVRREAQGSAKGTLHYRLTLGGVATDKVTAVIWGKQLTNYSDESCVEVMLSAGGKNDSDKFKKTQKDGNFECMALGVSCRNSFTYIDLYIYIKGDAAIEIGGIQIYMQDFGSFYNYDSNGNLTEMGKNILSATVQYNGTSTRPQQLTGINSQRYTFEYTEKGNPQKAVNAYDAETEYVYSSVYPNNQIKETTISHDKTKKIQSKTGYSADGRFIAEEYNDSGDRIALYSYDAFGKVLSVQNALDAKISYEYASDDTLKKIIMSKGAVSFNAQYIYDSHKRIESVTVTNGSKYSFVYDEVGNITEVHLNNTVLYKYQYDLITGNIIRQEFGQSGDALEFEYNARNLISKVTHINAAGTKSTKFTYEYNNRKQISIVKDGSGSVIKTFTYDEEGNVNELSMGNNNIKFSHDNLGNINTKVQNIDNKMIYQSFEHVSRSQSVHPQLLLSSFAKDDYLGLFEDSAQLSSSNYEPLNPLNQSQAFVFDRDGVLPYISLSASYTLGYQPKSSISTDYECGCVQFWFKPDNTTTKMYLWGSRSTKYSSYVTVYMGNDGKLYVDTCDSNKTTKTILISDQTVMADQWNFFAFDFIQRNDGLGYPAISDYGLTLNAHTQVYHQHDPMLNIPLYPDPIYYIGRRYDGLSTYCFKGKVACLCISPRWYKDTSEVQKFYRVTKDYIEDCQYTDSTQQTVDVSETVAFAPSNNSLSLFDIYPLHNNLLSLKGCKPAQFVMRKGVDEDRDKVFNFNPKIKRYVYVADGSTLVYDFGQNNSGTIIMRAFTDVAREKQYFFEGVDDNGSVIALYKKADNKLYVKYRSQEIATNLTFSINIWHTIGLSFDRVIRSHSMDYIKDATFRVFLDGNTFDAKVTISTVDIQNLHISIGRQFNGEKLESSNLAIYTDCYPLFGQIEMLGASTSYCTLSTLTTLMQEMKGVTKTNEFDEIGMLKKTNMYSGDTNLYSRTLAYLKRSDDNLYLSSRIGIETFGFKASTYIARQYKYDKMGNVTEICGETFGKHTYEYDYKNNLTKEDSTNYSYDVCGNIKSKGSTIFTYDTVVKDKLIKVGNNAITYDTDNPFVPKTYAGNTYEFDGGNLVKFIKSGKTYTYKYDEKGLRIQKNASTGETTRYIYDGEQLITEIGPTNRFDFLYDENGLLYGFIKNSSEKYFYIRDILQNILGIVDENGILVVYYDYSAFGSLISINGPKANTIGVENPIRYKGYYLDSESEMFYCQSRYYVPEWCRWLTADTLEYLDTDDLGNISLFAYCGNNPVNYFDPTGHIFWIAVALIAGALIGGIVAGVKASKEGAKGWELVGKITLGVTIGAAVAGLAVAAGAAIAGAASVIAGGSLGAATFMGVAAKTAFAVGASAYNFFAFVVAPLIGLSVEGIELGSSQVDLPNVQPTPRHPADKK